MHFSVSQRISLLISFKSMFNSGFPPCGLINKSKQLQCKPTFPLCQYFLGKELLFFIFLLTEKALQRMIVEER